MFWRPALRSLRAAARPPAAVHRERAEQRLLDLASLVRRLGLHLRHDHAGLSRRSGGGRSGGGYCARVVLVERAGGWAGRGGRDARLGGPDHLQRSRADLDGRVTACAKQGVVDGQAGVCGAGRATEQRRRAEEAAAVLRWTRRLHGFMRDMGWKWRVQIRFDARARAPCFWSLPSGPFAPGVLG